MRNGIKITIDNSAFDMRDLNLDILRIMACLMIVIMHAPLPAENTSGLFLSALSYFTAPGIGLFFMLSGALLLPIKEDMKTFLKKRFVKVVWPTVFWSLLYLLANWLMSHQALEWRRSLLSIPFSAQGTPVLWFIYTLLGLYLLAPILSRWLVNASSREIEFYLLLWVITLFYPLLKYVVDLNLGNTGILFYFSGYVGYFLLGYYLKRYAHFIQWKHLLPLLFVVIAVPVACKLMQLEVDFYDLFWYLSIFVVIQCVCWWKLVCGVKFDFNSRKVRSFVVELSKMTFGIYLIHIFVMRYLLWHSSFIMQIENYVMQTFTTVLLTFILSVVIVFLLGFLPFGYHLIGYKTMLRLKR